MHKIPGKTVFIGKKIISLPTCESTNTLMISMAQAGGMDEGSVLITENQTSGRGQAGNRWIVEPGANLTFSVLLRPDFIEPYQQFYLNMAIGLSLHDSVSILLDPRVKISLKWPNDIMADNKKISGILIENQVQGQKLLQAVVGVGLNVNQKNFDWPGASSLSLIAGSDFIKTDILELVLAKLEMRYEQLRNRDFQKLKNDYCAVLYWKGIPHEFQSEGRTFIGTIEGIDEIGRLLVVVDGNVVRFYFKEIKFIR